MSELTDQEVLKQENDAEMIRRPWLWPHVIVLPLKRWVDGQMETAVVRFGDLRDGEDTVTIRKGDNLFGALGTVEKVEYESALAVVDDGWVVD